VLVRKGDREFVCRRRGRAIIAKSVISEGLTEKEKVEQRLEEGESYAHITEERAF
jgi:hypothetical protein